MHMHMPSPCPVLLQSSPVTLLGGITTVVHHNPSHPTQGCLCPAMPCHATPHHAMHRKKTIKQLFLPSSSPHLSSLAPPPALLCKASKNRRQLWIDTVRPAGRCPIHPSDQKTGRGIFVHIQRFDIECVCHRKHSDQEEIKPISLGEGNGRLLLGLVVIK